MSGDQIYRELLRQLRGRWRLERQTPGLASMSGLAELTPLAADLSLYAEHGTLTMAAGGSFEFSRRYRYLATDNSLDILFDEEPPRLYQSLRLAEQDGALAGSGYHRCGEDDYSSSYAFELPRGFTTAHRVVGPKKDYVIKTRYRRA
jgi:hypothetical protein